MHRQVQPKMNSPIASERSHKKSKSNAADLLGGGNVSGPPGHGLRSLDSRSPDFQEKEEMNSALRKKHALGAHKRHPTEPKAPVGIDYSARNSGIQKKLLVKQKHLGVPRVRQSLQEEPPLVKEHHNDILVFEKVGARETQVYLSHSLAWVEKQEQARF